MQSLQAEFSFGLAARACTTSFAECSAARDAVECSPGHAELEQCSMVRCSEKGGTWDCYPWLQELTSKTTGTSVAVVTAIYKSTCTSAGASTSDSTSTQYYHHHQQGGRCVCRPAGCVVYFWEVFCLFARKPRGFCGSRKKTMYRTLFF